MNETQFPCNIWQEKVTKQEEKIGEEMERKEASNKECEKYEKKGLLNNSIGPVGQQEFA